MKNKKGITMVELVVSVALVSVAIVFLFKLLVDLKDEDNKSNIKPNYLTTQAILTKYLQNVLLDETIVSIQKCSSRCLLLNLSSQSKIQILISDQAVNENGVSKTITNQIITIKKTDEFDETLSYERRQLPKDNNALYNSNVYFGTASLKITKVTKRASYNYMYDSMFSINLPIIENDNTYDISVYYLFDSSANNLVLPASSF